MGAQVMGCAGGNTESDNLEWRTKAIIINGIILTSTLHGRNMQDNKNVG